MRKSIARRARNQRAPYACIEAVEAAVNDAVRRGLRASNANCSTNRSLPTRRRRCAMPSSPSARWRRCRTSRPTPQLRPTDNPAIVGAGTMGGGIAMSFADNGFDVKITDATQEALDRGMARIRANYETSVKRGSLAADEMERRLRPHPSGRRASTISPIATW